MDSLYDTHTRHILLTTPDRFQEIKKEHPSAHLLTEKELQEMNMHFESTDNVVLFMMDVAEFFKTFRQYHDYLACHSSGYEIQTPLYLFKQLIELNDLKCIDLQQILYNPDEDEDEEEEEELLPPFNILTQESKLLNLLYQEYEDDYDDEDDEEEEGEIYE